LKLLPHKISRRSFLQWLGKTGLALLASSCRAKNSSQSTPTPLPQKPMATPKPADTITSIPSATATTTTTSTPNPTASATPDYPAWVSTAQLEAYDPADLRRVLEQMISDSGVADSLLKTGTRVGIKVNLTGGTWWDGPDKPKATEYFVTHPLVVAALAEILHDLGASRIVVMDGLGDETSYNAWGYTAIAAPLGLELLDLCKPDPYSSYARFTVGENAQVYQNFLCNGTLEEIDVLLSIAKLKVHSVAGVTLSMKNLFGMVPISEYRRNPAQNNRSWFHESTAYDPRLARIILDLNRAFPIHLALIDGILTAEGGAGPWDAGLAQVNPGVLIMGSDPVATDSVATAVMGFNPAAAYPVVPFLHCDNHLALASQAGMGINDLSEIGVIGPEISELVYPFTQVG
jgi:uncharacterized protein (DUF362 family)